MELSFTIQGGEIIRGRIDAAAGNLKGVIILIHGLGEHLGRYDDWTGRFVREGFSVIRIDLPGHGISDGRRGHIKSFSMLSDIIDRALDRAGEDFHGVPVILYGHSLGGTIILNYLVSGSRTVDLAVVTSPWIRLSFDPPRSKKILAGIVKNILPSLVQPTGLVAEHLSHDSEVVKQYIEDPMVHSKISVALFAGVYVAANNIITKGSGLKIPVLLLHGEDDLITSPGGSSELADLSRNITFKLWDGGFHELHNDTSRDEVFEYIAGWLKKML